MRNFQMMVVKKLSFIFCSLLLIFSLNGANPSKPWTFLVYMARDNNLSDYGTHNIEQLKTVNNPNVNILVFDCHKINGVKEAQKLHITNGQVNVLETIADLDSGSPDSFTQACLWAINEFPSDKIAVVAWDHGSGILNRKVRKIVNRGFCYDDTTGNYLDDISVMNALNTVMQVRNGKQLDIFGFDSCLMAGAEMVASLAPYASYIVASEESIPGDGWDYANLLNWPNNSDLAPNDFAINIANTYANYYNARYESYTLSALDVAGWSALNTAINDLASQLNSIILNAQNPRSIRRIILNSSNRYFDDPTYMDIARFCKRLTSQVRYLGLDAQTAQNLQNALATTMKAVQDSIIVNVTSTNLRNTTGLSIYLPIGYVEPSYSKTYFAQNNAWAEFIKNYIG